MPLASQSLRMTPQPLAAVQHMQHCFQAHDRQMSLSQGEQVLEFAYLVQFGEVEIAIALPHVVRARSVDEGMHTVTRRNNNNNATHTTTGSARGRGEVVVGMGQGACRSSGLLRRWHGRCGRRLQWRHSSSSPSCWSGRWPWSSADDTRRACSLASGTGSIILDG